jgi:hypothetical protein
MLIKHVSENSPGTTRELELHAEQNFLTTENESTQILDKIF